MIVGASVAVLGWLYADIRDGQLRSQREIDRLGAVLARMPPRSEPIAGGDPERRTAHRIAQVARTAAREPALATSAEHDPDGEAEAPRPPPITFEESQLRVRSAFATEPIDASWGPDAERTLGGIVRSHLPAGSRLEGLACRTSMCEVRIIHADARAQAEFLRTGFHGWPGSLFVAEQAQDHGETAVTIIAAREGTEPPIAPR
jgi:hypothetical protein